MFDADAWGSTISFAPGISVALGGTLELAFAPDVNPASQLGRTIDLFDWTGVTSTGAFTIASPFEWDLSTLYTTGEVTLTAVPGLAAADFNGEGSVDGADLANWKAGFNAAGVATHTQGDADGDNDGDGADFSRVAAATVRSPAGRRRSRGRPRTVAGVAASDELGRDGHSLALVCI